MFIYELLKIDPDVLLDVETGRNLLSKGLFAFNLSKYLFSKRVHILNTLTSKSVCLEREISLFFSLRRERKNVIIINLIVPDTGHNAP